MRLIDLNEDWASFPGASLNDMISVIELNEIFLNSMNNRWSRQADLQGFDYEYITLKNLLISLSICKMPSLFTKV